MLKRIKNMTIRSVDLCKRGANPLADIKLTKSLDEEETHMNAQLEALEKAMDESNRTILTDATLSDDERVAMLCRNANDYALAKAKAGAFDEEDADEPDGSAGRRERLGQGYDLRRNGTG